MVKDLEEEKFVFHCCLQGNRYFLSNVLKFLKPYHFQSQYRRKVYQSLESFFNQFERPPALWELKDYCLRTIRDEQMREGVENILKDIPEIQINEDNMDYMVDKVLKFVKKSVLVDLVDEVISNLSKGNVEQAEALVKSFKGVSVDDSAHFFGFQDMIVDAYLQQEEDFTLEFSGLLGELIGPLRPGWLVGVLAPSKRGKTWFLIHTALDAMFSRLKVYFVSLEMPRVQLSRRFIRALSKREDDEEWKLVADCVLNQEGTCSRPERKNRIPLKINGDFPQRYEDTPEGYQPCTACRDKKDSHFRLSGWRVKNSQRNVKPKADENYYTQFEWTNKLYGHFLYASSYPAYSVRIQDILMDLNVLESSKNFIPKVVVIDYADLLASLHSYDEYRHQLDEIWKGLKGLAMEKNCIVMTASQATRASMSKHLLDTTDVAEDIRKLAHCDLMIGLNQTDRERKTSILRINVIAKREGFFDPKRQLKCLADFEHGRLRIDESWK